jgi:hypothetical protein
MVQLEGENLAPQHATKRKNRFDSVLPDKTSIDIFVD